MSVVATKKSAKAARQTARTSLQRFNQRKYADLLAESLPATITSDKELDRFTAIVDRLAVKKDLSPEESRLLELLSTLIEIYENEHYPIPDAPPHVMIQGFMQDRGLRNKDLEPILGSSGVTSQVVSGKRNPSKTQIKKLADFFGVSPEFFISLD
jgi:HTH-type transcriptional regulator/antitoxin HigA